MSIKNVGICVSAKSDSFAAVLKEGAKKLSARLKECGISELTNTIQVPLIALCEVKRGEAGDKGFSARFSGQSHESEYAVLEVLSAHKNLFQKAFDELLDVLFEGGELNFKEFEPSFDTSRVYYSDFGAVGDGIANDYAPIKAAHDFANEGGQTVYADGGKTYRFTDAPKSILIKTDVDFCGATLIFDDTRVTSPENKNVKDITVHSEGSVFRLVNDYSYIRSDDAMAEEINSVKDDDGYVLRGMESGGKSDKINLKLGYPALLLIKNTKYQNYIRYGFVGNKGGPQREILLIDGEGNIDPSTPLLHDYRDITNVIIQRQDVEAITVKNATVKTLAPRINNQNNCYVNRNFAIERPHVTFENIQHSVIGEIPRAEPVRCDAEGLSYSVASEGYTGRGRCVYDKNGNLYEGDDIKTFYGPSYNGFVYVDLTNDVHFKNCSFQSRVLYLEGTYDIAANSANNIVFEDCTQLNFFEKSENGEQTAIPNMTRCWGVAGTNYCKNMDYIRSRLTRYDAHAGVVNGKIIDSEIAVLCLIGGGDFTVSGTKIHASANNPIVLRHDYGASFNGTLTVKDCTVIDAHGSGTTVQDLIYAPNSYWDFGYKTFFPNLVIDNLKFPDTKLDKINLIRSAKATYPNTHFPTRNIIREKAHDPAEPFDFYYDGRDTEKYIEENIKNENGKFHGLDYKLTENGNGINTLIINDTENRFPYTPPKFIKVINNKDNGYTLSLFDADFFKSTEIITDEGSLEIIKLQ